MHSRRFLNRADAQTTESSHTPPAVTRAAAVSRTTLHCAVFVALAIILRMMFAIPFAIASNAVRNDDLESCSSECDSCQNTWFLVYIFTANHCYIRVIFLIIRSRVTYDIWLNDV